MPPEYRQDMTLLKSWLDRDVRVWELVVPRYPEESPEQWIYRLATVVQNLGGQAWCVNTHELVRNLQMPMDKALLEWGRHFWPCFKKNSLFFFKAENDARLIRQRFLQWQKENTLMCFRRRYDMTVEQSPASFSERKTGPVGRFFRSFRTSIGLCGQEKN